MIELSIFLSFLIIGAGAYGGGLASIPLIEHEVVIVNQWLSETQMSELIAVAQMTPGPIAVNAATFAGYRIFGVRGALIATTTVLTPSIILCTLLTLFINRLKNHGIIEQVRSAFAPAVLGLIMSAVWSYGRAAVTDLPTVILALSSFILLVVLRERVMPVFIVILGGLAGIVIM